MTHRRPYSPVSFGRSVGHRESPEARPRASLSHHGAFQAERVESPLDLPKTRNAMGGKALRQKPIFAFDLLFGFACSMTPSCNRYGTEIS